MADEQTKLNDMLKRVENLEARLDATLQQAEKRSIMMKAVAAILVVGLGVYFVIAFTMIGGFTPDQAFRVLQQQAEADMPARADEVAQWMIDEAPRLLDDAEARAMEIPHQATEFIRVNMATRAEEHIDHMEKELYEGLKAQIDQAAAAVKESGQGPLDEAKAKELLDRALADYRKQTDDVLTEAYGWYTSRAADIVDYLHRLAKADDLNQREQYHRNLVQLFLAMMERKMEAGIDTESLEGVESLNDVVKLRS